MEQIYFNNLCIFEVGIHILWCYIKFKIDVLFDVVKGEDMVKMSYLFMKIYDLMWRRWYSA